MLLQSKEKIPLQPKKKKKKSSSFNLTESFIKTDPATTLQYLPRDPDLILSVPKSGDMSLSVAFTVVTWKPSGSVSFTLTLYTGSEKTGLLSFTSLIMTTRVAVPTWDGSLTSVAVSCEILSGLIKKETRVRERGGRKRESE